MWIAFVFFVKIGITYGFAIEKKELGDKIDITEANFTVGESITLGCTASVPLDTCKWVHKKNSIKHEVLVMCSGSFGFSNSDKKSRKSNLDFMPESNIKFPPIFEDIFSKFREIRIIKAF